MQPPHESGEFIWVDEAHTILIVRFTHVTCLDDFSAVLQRAEQLVGSEDHTVHVILDTDPIPKSVLITQLQHLLDMLPIYYRRTVALKNLGVRVWVVRYGVPLRDFVVVWTKMVGTGCVVVTLEEAFDALKRAGVGHEHDTSPEDQPR